MPSRNVNLTDRIFRALLGAGLVSLVFFGPQTAWGYIGLIAIISALSGFCPIYRVFEATGLKANKTAKP